jgi:hypothetical protein
MPDLSWIDDLMKFKGFWTASFSDKIKWIPLALFFYGVFIVNGLFNLIYKVTEKW